VSFSDPEKNSFIAALATRGWQVRDGVLWSPGGGLSFNDSTFAAWTPREMKDIFTNRAARIENLPYENAARDAAENRDVHWAADEVLRGHSPR
jgi:hypothetical protein